MSTEAARSIAWVGTGRRWLVGILAVGVLLALVLGFRGGRSALEPVHQGRRYSAWLDEAPGTQPRNLAAQAALQAIGTNAIPFLLEQLTYKDSPAKARLAESLRSFRAISIGLSPWWEDAAKRRYRGRRGLSHLILNGVDLHPTLFVLLEAGGDSGRLVLESLDEALVERELADPRFWAALRRLLEHPDPEVRNRTRGFLKAGFGVDGLGDMDEVRLSLRQSLSSSASRAWVALEGLGVPPDLAQEIIRDGLKDPSAVIRCHAAWASVWRGTNGIRLLPFLEAALAQEPQMPRNAGVTISASEVTQLMTRAVSELRARDRR
jgi:hypothetical protein